jgi:hypothetical protein
MYYSVFLVAKHIFTFVLVLKFSKMGKTGIIPNITNIEFGKGIEHQE